MVLSEDLVVALGGGGGGGGAGPWVDGVSLAPKFIADSNTMAGRMEVILIVKKEFSMGNKLVSTLDLGLGCL